MTTPADQPDLIAFVRARYDERTERAKAAANYGEVWRAGSDKTAIWPSDESRHPGPIIIGPYGDLEEQHTDHIVDNDPAFVLADLASKRAILDLHAPVELRALAFRPAMLQCEHCAGLCHSRSGLGCDEPIDAPWPCPTVRLLAAPFASHPDYREEWRP